MISKKRLEQLEFKIKAKAPTKIKIEFVDTEREEGYVWILDFNTVGEITEENIISPIGGKRIPVEEWRAGLSKKAILVGFDDDEID